MLVTMNEQDPRFGHVAGPGFWFGETEVVTGEAGIIEMVAASETTLIALNRAALDAIAKDHPGVWPALTLLAVQNQGLAIGAADDLMLRNTTQRLAAVLLRLSARRNAFQGVPPLTHIPASWNELAEAASMSRSKVAAILSEFASANLIRTRQRWIEIVNAKGLENVLNRPAAK
jgi:CRP-like cAMP-binding protein